MGLLGDFVNNDEFAQNHLTRFNLWYNIKSTGREKRKGWTGMYTVKTTYFPHELKLNMKYVCACGHKMTRVNSDYYTMSPFNLHTEEACKANLNYSVFTQKRECPKCGAAIVPILTDEQKVRVSEWKRIYDADCERLKQI